MYILGSAANTLVLDSFADWPNYGRAKRGHFALQGDHEGSLGFRNIRVREIK